MRGCDGGGSPEQSIGFVCIQHLLDIGEDVPCPDTTEVVGDGAAWVQAGKGWQERGEDGGVDGCLLQLKNTFVVTEYVKGKEVGSI